MDRLGLDHNDSKLILGIIDKFRGGPVGLDTVAATIGEEPHTIEDVYEPFLLQIGFLQRTPRGRTVTHAAYHHFNREEAQNRLNPFAKLLIIGGFVMVAVGLFWQFGGEIFNLGRLPGDIG